MTEVIIKDGRSGIYAIRNKKSGKCYVGSAVNFSARWKRHRTELRGGVHHSEKLQRAWQKHGEDMFEFVVLEVVSDLPTLVEREQHWLDKFCAAKAGYNVSPTAGSVLGVKHTEAMREKMRKVRAENPITPEQHAKMAEARRNSPEFMAKIAALGKSRVGFKHTEEAKQKISARSRELMQDPERREQKRIASTGWKQTNEAKEKISASKRGKPFSPEHREALAKARRAYLERTKKAA